MGLSRLKSLQKQIEDYITTIQECGLVFKEAMKEYLEGSMNLYSKRVSMIKVLERQADDLKAKIKHKLYTDMLIPDSRGDVLGILETMDDVADETQRLLLIIDIERPSIPEELKNDFLKLAEYSENSIEELSKAVMSYFVDTKMCNSYINRVYFLEHEVDTIVDRLKRSIFSNASENSLSTKMHLRYFVEELAKISDVAEDVCERLSISIIKRSI